MRVWKTEHGLSSIHFILCIIPFSIHFLRLLCEKRNLKRENRMHFSNIYLSEFILVVILCSDVCPDCGSRQSISNLGGKSNFCQNSTNIPWIKIEGISPLKSNLTTKKGQKLKIFSVSMVSGERTQISSIFRTFFLKNHRIFRVWND